VGFALELTSAAGRHAGGEAVVPGETKVLENLSVGRGNEAVLGGQRQVSSQELLAQHGDVEITRHRIAAGKVFYLDEASEWAGFEFIYLLRGTLVLTDDGRTTEFVGGDYLYHAGLPERAYFRVGDYVELLMVSSPPSFHLIKDEVPEMLALARSVEEKDEGTEGHCHRLERLAIKTGERLGLSGQRLIDLSYGAYLHDIGKIRVPDGVLSKEAPLSDEEWEEMRRHPEHGAELLAEKDYLKAAAGIVVAHHERYDGSGYPRGLRGDEIPIEARVIAVVDAYDAITSERPYQPALARKQAIEELRANAGTHFDPQVVRAFVSVVEDADKDA
jgi:HD-GYP domain-containing protein (c-di-GMP phosphodiesterase class II)